MPVGDLEAIVDDEDYDSVISEKWYLAVGYAQAAGSVYMHRLLMGFPEGMEIDHRNGNKLDNRKENLRVATHQQNLFNRSAQKNNVGGDKGIHLTKSTGRWRAQLKFGKRRIHVGYFDSPEEAARAYDRVAIEKFGEFAYLNFPEEAIKGETR